MANRTEQISSYWIVRLLRKGVWVLGFIPLLLDLHTSYLLGDSPPVPILQYLERGTTWSLTAVLVPLGLLFSAYLVHRDSQARINELDSRQAHLTLRLFDVDFFHKSPALIIEDMLKHGIKLNGLPVEAIIVANIEIENIGNEEGELDWELDTEACDLPEIFCLIENRTRGTMSNMPERFEARTRLRVQWRLDCGIQEEDPRIFASALSENQSYSFVIQYRTLRVGEPTRYARLRIEGDFQAYHMLLIDIWNRNGMSELTDLANKR